MATIKTAGSSSFLVKVDDKGVLVRIPRFSTTQGLRAFFPGKPTELVFFRFGGPEIDLEELGALKLTVVRLELRQVDAYKLTIGRHEFTFDSSPVMFDNLRLLVSLINGATAECGLVARLDTDDEGVIVTNPDPETGELRAIPTPVADRHPQSITWSPMVQEASGGFIHGGTPEELATRGAAFLALKALPGEEHQVLFNELEHVIVTAAPQKQRTGLNPTWDHAREQKAFNNE